MNVFADEVFSVDDLFDDFSQSQSGNENWKKKQKKEKLEKKSFLRKTKNWSSMSKDWKSSMAMPRLEKTFLEWVEPLSGGTWENWKAAQKALWFLEQFSLKFLTLEVEQKDGVHQNTNINFNHAEPTTSESGMSDENKNQIEKVLFLMDKFGVSEEF